MKTQILEQAENQREKLEIEIEKLRNQMNSYQIRLRKASQIYDKLEQTLNKLGLKIDKYYVPNFESSDPMGNVMKYDNLFMKVQAVKNETNKFRFIAHAGYDSKGAGRNRTKLQNKAEVLSAKLSETIDCSVSINPYSLEINEPDSVGRVLIQVKIEK